VVRGRPTGLLQSVSGLRAAAMTRWWSSSGAEPARCPKNLKRRDFTLSETGKHPVILQIVSLVVCLVYGFRKIYLSHSKNSITQSTIRNVKRPVTQQGAENHKTVFKVRDDLGSFSSLQQQLASRLELSKRQVLSTPLSNHLLQLSFNVFLFVCWYADILQHITPDTLKTTDRLSTVFNKRCIPGA